MSHGSPTYNYQMATEFNQVEQRNAALTEARKPALPYLVGQMVDALTYIAATAAARAARLLTCPRYVVRENAEQTGYWMERVYSAAEVQRSLQKTWCQRLSSQPLAPSPRSVGGRQ